MSHARRSRPVHRYERLFIVFSAAVEKQLKRAVILLLLLVVLFQALLQVSAFRKSAVQTERLEGEPLVQKIGEEP